MAKRTSWDEALAAFAHYLSEATVPQRIEAWNRLQRRASEHAGIQVPGRIPWPEAFLHLNPDDLVELVTA